MDFATEQTGQLTADRQSESRAAILTAGTCVGLLECFEDDALFFRWNADAGVLDLESNDGWCCTKNGMVVAPTALGQEHGQPHAALFGEFKCVGKQILEDLLQSFRICDQAAAQSRICR